MRSIHVFVISWAGHHENAIAIAENAAGVSNRLDIVFSDPNPSLTLNTKCNLIRRSNELYWSDKFKACLDACQSDLMLVIHGDCQCDDWAALVRRCQLTMSNDLSIGVWAPLIDGTHFKLNRVRILGVGSTSLSIVTNTDGIVFCLSRAVLERMRLANYEDNVHGWGIDTMAVASAFANKMFAVIDQSVAVMHPRSRGYDQTIALAQMKQFLTQLTPVELIQFALLNSKVRLNDLTASKCDNAK